MKKKLLSLALAVALVAIGVVGTLAYLTDTSGDMVNTFTVGNIGIELDEAVVEESDGEYKYVATDSRTKRGQSYENLLPGDKVQKDPTINMLTNSVDGWVFIEVTMKSSQARVFAKAAGVADTTAITDATVAEAVLGNYDADKWTLESYKTAGEGDAETVTFVLGYNEACSAGDKAVLFTELVVPASLENADMEAIDGMTMTFFARAIQKSGVADLAAAYDALYADLGFTAYQKLDIIDHLN